MIILMGLAGAGKSTQGRLFADEYGIPWISTGELLRVLVTGRRRREMALGKLLTDEDMIAIMDKVFSLINLDGQFILDGFPRTLGQAEWLLGQANNGRYDVDAVFNLVADQAALRSRLLARGRMDDTDAAITDRFDEYEQVTKPIVQRFVSHGVKVFEIDASRTRERVHDAMELKIASLGLIEPV